MFMVLLADDELRREQRADGKDIAKSRYYLTRTDSIS